MESNGRRVVLTGTGSFLPNAPVTTADIDQVLGPLTEAPEEVRKFAARFARKFASRCGVEYRHYAIDLATGRMTHNVASLAEPACRAAMTAAGIEPRQVDMLLISSPFCDQGTPPTSAILQEALGIGDCVEMEIHANCSGLFKCVQIACDAIRLGRCRTVLVTYSQVSSGMLRSCFYNQPKMTKTQAALRYILTDGAGAMVLQAAEAHDGEPVAREILNVYVESTGWSRRAAMTAGAGMADLASLGSFREIFERGSHHLDQDLVTVSREAADFLLAAVRRHVLSTKLPPESVVHLVASVPSVQQYQVNCERFREFLPSFRFAREFPYRCSGYCGGAAVLVSLDELIRSGAIQPGETALVHAIESSKWMSGGFALRW